MAWPYAGTIINDAAAELGLWTGAVEPFTSPDPLPVQLASLLRPVGVRLVRAHPWTQLLKTATLTPYVLFGGYSTQASHPLPDDFARLVDETAWNRHNNQPISFTSSQAWAARQGPSLGTSYRIQGGKIIVSPVPTPDEALSFEYVSSRWVANTEADIPTRDRPLSTSDVLWLDEYLLTAGLKLEFLRVKGFDTTAAQAEYDEAFAFATGADATAERLSLNAPRAARLLDWSNAPEGGWS